MKEIHNEYTDRLAKAVASLKSTEECYAFLEDLCTIKELQEMSQRLEVARLLDKGMSYQKISENTNASSTTISRVKRCLDYGSGGYEKALKALNEDEEAV
ncbi:MAG: helix-turn-helix domain-containing protein [Lachnospiraceae bacterium]|nr:helix-turn-helix domain-containing protein [Lachnospiraceae bacterium]